MFKQRVRVSNIQKPELSFEEDFWVDTGVLYSFIPEDYIPCPVVFAPKGSLLLLGATALENFGVEADPVHKTLKPILAVIGGFPASSPAPRQSE